MLACKGSAQFADSLLQQRKLKFQSIRTSANRRAYAVNEFPARKSRKMFVHIGASFNDTGPRGVFDPGSLRLYFEDIDKSRVRSKQRLEAG
jgi:hypothetical protein